MASAAACSKDSPDLAILTSPKARTLRILAEYLEPEARCEREGVDKTVVFFGSARARCEQDAGGRSVGHISLPHEQDPNPYITEELNVEFHYFFMRKLWFVQMAVGLVVFPGGFGTLDELAGPHPDPDRAESAHADHRLWIRILG